MESATQQTAIITGASRGLGLALARRLAQNHWRLILDARGADVLEAARKELAYLTEVVAIPGDITDGAHREALAHAAAQQGHVDVIINNASTLGLSPQPTLVDFPLDMLTHVYQTNVFAPLALIQLVRPYLAPRAVVINVTSDAGFEAYPGWGGYGSSKAALAQLTSILAAEQPGWRVYAVDPGDMRTEMHQAAFPGEDISDRPPPEVSVPGFMALITGDLPSGRYTAREVASDATNISF